MTKSFSIREMKSSDLDLVLYWRNQPNVRNYMLTQHEISAEEHQKWFESNATNTNSSLLIVEENTIPIGFVQFKRVDSEAVADWGFYTSPNATKGTGFKLGVTALNHAFHFLQFHKVCGQALSFNLKSIKLHLKLGFHQEGILRQQHQIEGSYKDLFFFGLLRDEWKI